LIQAQFRGALLESLNHRICDGRGRGWHGLKLWRAGIPIADI
jgi:hypothetical protein